MWSWVTRVLDPRRLAHALDAIDREWRHADATGWRHPATVLVVAGLCLFAIHYLKNAGTLAALVDAVGGADARRALLSGPWAELAFEAWWGLAHLVGYVALPVVAMRTLPLPRVANVTGCWRWGRTGRWLGWCALLAAPIVGFAAVASFTPAFQHTYPFYGLAGRSWLDLLAWEAIYLSQFVFLEYFFRGFLLHALAPRFGAAAIFVMVVPYLMIHFPKPAAEAFGALPFGILLGIIALRTGSIWGGVAVHATIALSMDLLSLAQKGQWPAGWAP